MDISKNIKKTKKGQFVGKHQKRSNCISQVPASMAELFDLCAMNKQSKEESFLFVRLTWWKV